MKNKTKSTAVAQPKVKKKSAARVLSARDARPFLSDPKKGISTYDELSEEQRIAEGYTPPFVQPLDFKKKRTEKERELLAKLKGRCVNANSRGASIPKPKTHGFKQRFTVHRMIKGGKTPANFTNTCSAVIYRDEISSFLHSIYTTAYKEIGKVIITKMTFGNEVLKDLKNAKSEDED